MKDKRMKEPSSEREMKVAPERNTKNLLWFLTFWRFSSILD